MISEYFKFPSNKLMCATFLAATLGIALPALAQHSGKKKPILPDHVLNATYVYVEAYDGTEFDPRVLPEDREAIADVERAVEKWGRYHVTLRRSEAQIVIQVRKGRIASAQGSVGGTIGTTGPSAAGGTIPNGPNSRNGSNGEGFPPNNRADSSGVHAGARAEAGPPDDFFWVFELDPNGHLSVPYWRKSEKDCLNTPDLELFKKFKDDVEAAAKSQALRKAAAGGSGVPAAVPAGKSAPTPTTGTSNPPAAAPQPHI